MSPVNFYEEDRSRVVLNGPRPSPLKISKESQTIQKPSSSYQTAVNISNEVKVITKQHQQHKPVIIYTHSPKIIHTKPRDFMALVQKLTGFSRSGETKTEGADQGKQYQTDHFLYDREKEYDSSSVITSDEKYEGENNNNNKGVKPYMAEMPLFTPNSTNLFFSPQGLLRNPDSVVPAGLGSLSPTFLEFLNMKEFPEY